MIPALPPDRSREPISVLFAGTPSVDLRETDALRSHSVDVEIAGDGREAIRRLTAASMSPADDTMPDLVLMKFGFRSPDGPTVLHAIKSSPRPGSVPVVVLDAGEGGVAGANGKRAHGHAANARVRVPETTEGYANLLDRIGQFWADWARYPAKCLFADR